MCQVNSNRARQADVMTVPLYFDTRHVNWMHSDGQFMCRVCLLLQPQKCVIHINVLKIEEVGMICKNVWMMERHQFPHTALMFHIPWKHLVALPVVVELNCFSTQFTLTFCLFAVTKGGAQLFCSMEKEDLKVLNKGEEEEMVCLSVILHLRQCVSLCFPIYRPAPPFLLPLFRSCRATVCVVGGWPWWASVCCVQGASSSCCSTGCQSGASNPPALVPQPVMPMWYWCAPW